MKHATRIYATTQTPQPEVQLLSNGRYHVMLTNAGSGYSRWNNLAVTRWREDPTLDNWGTFCYIRDTVQNACWSATHQPIGHTKDANRPGTASFSGGIAEFTQEHSGFVSHTSVAVAPDDDIELRRIHITNQNQTPATLDLTSFAEVVLAVAAADAAHPAFSNLFIQSEIHKDVQAILCTRRPRSREERFPCMVHMLTVHGAEQVGEASYETNRARFIGRERSVACPAAMDAATSALSNTEGSVLDPSVSVRARIRVQPGQSVLVDVITGIGETRAAALALAKKYRERAVADAVFDAARALEHAVLRQLQASDDEGQLYNTLAGRVLYADASLRPPADVLARNRKGQPSLWAYGISADLPIVLLRLQQHEDSAAAQQLIRAHAYWRRKGLAVDLVIVLEGASESRPRLQEHLTDIAARYSKAAGLNSTGANSAGGVFIRSIDSIAEDDLLLLKSVARAVLSDTEGSLRNHFEKNLTSAQATTAQINKTYTCSTGGYTADARKANATREKQSRSEHCRGGSSPDDYSPGAYSPGAYNPDDLLFFNGTGGFSADGKEYVILTDHGKTTPAPWVNVMANPGFGSVVSESGLSYTWAENAHEFRLTPWSNDPVGDSQGEAFYLRDEEDGYYWSPTPQPCRGKTPYRTRHGFGYSVFEHEERGLATDFLVFTDADDPIKYSVLTVRNTSGRTRELSATGYVEWVLGELAEKNRMHVVTHSKHADGPIFANNHYNTDFAGRTAFFDAKIGQKSDAQASATDDCRSITCDRAEFLGRNGQLCAPAAMATAALSGTCGAGLDPCAAIRIPFSLAPQEERVLVFRLGLGEDAQKAHVLAKRCRGSVDVQKAFAAVGKRWATLLESVQVTTPDPAFTVMSNGWLLYQAISCRLWGRTATYQSGGAFGFRDQLQDVMALVHAAPDLLREHLLQCAAHQFAEGDVLHWWHPPSSKGVRTKCSDDYLWLPLAATHYVNATGDAGIFDEHLPFVQGRSLAKHEESYYGQPLFSERAATFYDHCVKAVRYGLRFGAHGLPFIGSCDWNDGMNLVGKEGRGESVWLGFFLYRVLKDFAPFAETRGDHAFAALCLKEAENLARTIEAHAWDGAWYRRAYFDDGTPLGSAVNDECRIDSIAQSWAVLSGAAEPLRASAALDALYTHLVRSDLGLVQLFTPPFDSSPLDPGYIKGYVPGVRENGGQYTHAAVWAAMAFAKNGDAERAWELCNIINPVRHSNSPEATAIYKTEPYVMAADVYAAPGHIGRGGWTWYTGAAAWMYRLMLESLLGLNREKETLRLSPCLPPAWNECSVRYIYKETVYHIHYTRRSAHKESITISLDGTQLKSAQIPLVNDKAEHRIDVVLPWRNRSRKPS